MIGHDAPLPPVRPTPELIATLRPGYMRRAVIVTKRTTTGFWDIQRVRERSRKRGTLSTAGELVDDGRPL
jgi:hypothetical protein